MKKIIYCGLVVLLASGSVSCRDKSRKQAIVDERAKWEASLQDSLKIFESQLDEAQKSLPELRNEVGEMLSKFTPVNNPREVEGYYIYSAARGNYPLSSTSVTARLSKSEAPEIIAALKGGTFTSIRFCSSDGSSVVSEVVPYDQALNYRAGGLNTVAFTGQSIDSLLLFVVNHSGENLSIEYLNPNIAGKKSLSLEETAALVETGRLVEARRLLHQAEMKIPALSRKIQRLKSREQTTDNDFNNASGREH